MPQKVRLLLVDDEINTLEGLAAAIDWEKIGIGEIRTAQNGQAALEIAGQFQPDIVISDISMPRMNGIELSAELARRFPGCRTIFITGNCEIDYLKSAFKNGVVDYILKPIDCSELESTVQKVLAAIRKEREERDYRAYLEEQLQKNLPSMRSQFFNLVIDGRFQDVRQMETRLREFRGGECPDSGPWPQGMGAAFEGTHPRERGGPPDPGADRTGICVPAHH